MDEELLRRHTAVKDRLEGLRSYLDLPGRQKDLDQLTARMGDPGFWGDPAAAQAVNQRRSKIEAALTLGKKLFADLDDSEVLVELGREGEPVEADLEAAVEDLSRRADAVELQMMLRGEYDHSNAILNINAGAGGTEAQDWADMLYRMYLRWCERRGYRVEVMDIQQGEEAGIKSATLLVSGENAYGYLRAENGVHRLVRISPYDANARRHTSFAAVYATPDLDETIEIKIEDKDLRVDTYRSSGAGGQHVNVTDSAVRITHLPSGLVVACQNERSQHRNREMAMRVLRSRLYDMEMKKQDEKRSRVEGTKREIGFGSQIRSYVLHPYKQVKDLRTGEISTQPQDVLDGDIDDFIRTYLLAAGTGTLGKTVVADD
ncbi:MAG: peptide chain release factor 2 [Acidobacteria bacterium]|nr:peptide chain release factor 2 [Acidobacteriota bacterium]